MQRSSDSIAKLAAALAKAQTELVNPEKSLVATIFPDGAGEGERTFSYASLASGLEIVRKTLGQHEIATIQTTAIDEASQMVKLTTVLAHASGEWIASDWPVCPVSEAATPHRMGAALTYARRYALFTLVGIAGEDDLDAPDLRTTPPGQKAPVGQAPVLERRGGMRNGRLDGRRNAPLRDGKRSAAAAGPAKTLAPDAAAVLRGRLLGELQNLGSADEAAIWAQRSLAPKNQLADEDARQVEEAFGARLAVLAAGADATQAALARTQEQPADGGASNADQMPGERPDRSELSDQTSIVARADTRIERITASAAAGPRSDRRGRRQRATPMATRADTSIDKSVLAFPEPRRIRDREHIRHVIRQPCLVCGRTPSDAHHLRFAQPMALGRKVSDQFTVPLCRGHHRELHRTGDEAAWWRTAGVDPAVAARKLWRETHPLPAIPDHSRADDNADNANNANDVASATLTNGEVAS
jgi:ERF superfamily